MVARPPETGAGPGVDGWKLDGCDTFFSGTIGKVPVPFNQVHSGWMTTRQYMNHYAREEYRHGLTSNPEFIVMIRAIDQPWSHPEGFAPLDAAPVTWVGDNRHTWKQEDRGIEGAISDILRSARLGYCVIGSDVGGYHGRGNPEDIGPATAALLSSWKSKAGSQGPSSTEFGTAADNNQIPPNIYIRWAELSAFCGFFLNGGHGERRLWRRSQPELEIVRKFSWLHTELVPYIYSHVVACHRGAPSLIRPLPGAKFDYFFGDDFLVAPIHEDSLTRTVSLPPGGWRYLFDDHEIIEGPRKITREFALDEFPVYVREGAIVPMNVKRSYTGYGDKDSTGFTTWLIYPYGMSEFVLHHPESHPTPETTTVKVNASRPLRIEFSGKHEPHLLRVCLKDKPSRITLDGRDSAEGDGWRYDSADHRLIIRTRSYTEGAYVIFEP